MTRADIVVGLQWGDEGKGKIVDRLAPSYDAIIRANGGDNAGHSISANGKEYAVHILPSGSLQEGKLNIIASGCVVNPISVVKEINTLGEDFVGNLLISERCPLILQKHIKLDKELEDLKGDNAIGTTLKGIGPAYADLKYRDVIFAGDLLNIDKTLERFTYLSADKLLELKTELEKLYSLIGQYIGDTYSVIHNQKEVLIEGAQASMLDNLYGAYPYVTSSNTIVPSLLMGASLNHTNVKRVIGVTKAYTTRVGNGPFISEDTGEQGEKLRTIGKEVGVSTGRLRRCGWIDLVQLKYAIELNGVTELAIMKSDVLDTFENIKVCTAYRNIKTDETIDYVPFDLENYAPVYVEFDGWLSETYGETDLEKLPENLITYLRYISESLETNIRFISTGPKREQICLV